MTAAVPNPAGSALLRPRYLGSLSYTKAGAYAVSCPTGTKLVRFSLRGGGGGGGSYTGGGYGGYGGGQGALTRKLIAFSGSSMSLVIGSGGVGQISGDGSNGTAATAGAGGSSTLYGFTAQGGQPGRQTTTAEGYSKPPSGGVGVDGAETLLGYGQYSGVTASIFGGGGGNVTTFAGSAGSLGAGGNGSSTDNKQAGGAGGDGFCYLEFFG